MAPKSLMQSKEKATRVLWGKQDQENQKLLLLIIHFLHFVKSFLVHIDENGDAAGNYTILGVKLVNNSRGNTSTFGLFPLGTFVSRSTVENGSQSIPVRKFIQQFVAKCALCSRNTSSKSIRTKKCFRPKKTFKLCRLLGA